VVLDMRTGSMLQQLPAVLGLPAQAEVLQRLQQQGEQALQGIAGTINDLPWEENARDVANDSCLLIP